ncbi:MAG TPA: thiol reductant ABC exporter subunit CydD [Candidatus Limnocylindrales bacterium]|nr:thiol reductant ABC exporter subunit CydD [Candidatus Limnocylindrales bacterium]
MTPLDRRLARLAPAVLVHLAFAVLLGLITAALAIGQAGLLADAISGAFLGAATNESLSGTLVALALVLAGRAAIGWAQKSSAHGASAAVKSRLRIAILARAVRLGPGAAGGATTGGTAPGGTAGIVALATRGVDALDAYFAKYLPQVALAAIIPVAVVASLLAADAVAALTVALTIPVILTFMVLIGWAAGAHRRRRWQAMNHLAHHFLDVVQGLPTLKVFGRSRAQVDALGRVTESYRVETMGALRIAFLSAFALEFFATLSVALVAVGVGLRLVVGDLDLRTGLFVLVIAPEAYLPLRQLGLQFHASEEGRSAIAAAFELIDTPERPPGTRTDVPDPWTSSLRVGDIEVRQPGRDLLAPAGASLAVRPGEIVAISGPSGAGKSTLLLAILGLVPVDRGEIAIVATDGRLVPIGEIDPSRWRRELAWVAQAPYLVAGTVAENVRLAAPDASDADVVNALRAVGLGDVNPSLVLGERGVGLSSGERRRVAVARALARKAPILLVDEPTAGLDAETERVVLAAIAHEARVGGAKVLLVAHRPAAVAIADREVRVTSRAMASGATTDGAPAPAGETAA